MYIVSLVYYQAHFFLTICISLILQKVKHSLTVCFETTASALVINFSTIIKSLHDDALKNREIKRVWK